MMATPSSYPPTRRQTAMFCLSIVPGSLQKLKQNSHRSNWDFRILITHHTPTDANGRLNYDPAIVDRHATRMFGRPLFWAPISPICRDLFEDAGMTQPRLRDDWNNVVFVDDWGAARSGLLGDRPVVGRHSRPQLEKWPATREELLAAYPDDVEVRLLGVGDEARALIQPLPDNWTAWGFSEISVRDFLNGIDLFVYFHHPDWIETFGLTIAEAAAAGCVVVTHPYLKRTFGKAALYCPPERTPTLIRNIAQDPRRFVELSAQGRKAIEDQFGPEEYLLRFQRLLAASRHSTLLEDLVVQPKRGAQLALKSYTKRLTCRWLYWWHNEILPGWQRLLRSKTLRRPMRKITKALKIR